MKLKDIVPHCLNLKNNGYGYDLRYYWIIDGLTYTIDTLETKSPDFKDGLFDHKLHSDTINYIHLSRYNFVNPHEKPNQYDDRKNYLTLNLNNEITIHNSFIMVHKTENETTDSELDLFFKTNYYIANGHSASIQNYTIGLFHPITHCMMVDLRTTVFKDLIVPPVPPKPAELTLDEKVDDLIDELMKDSRTTAIVSAGLEDYIQNLIDNPGGGLRKSTINVIAARPKTGKTLLADNMGFHIANKLNIPVLNLDTEMTKEDHINRLIAMITEIEINKIETGKFNDSTVMRDKVSNAIKQLKETPLYYKPIAGKPFEEQLSIMKRWIVKNVGLNSDGTAKRCVIFYDYLKLMDSAGISQDMKEYQVLGFMMTSLHNFACKYQIPIVAFVQLRN